jgi:nucleoside-diphosphate-sugar epimerase
MANVSMSSVRTLAITGYPGWLMDAVMRHLSDAGNQLDRVVMLVHPPMLKHLAPLSVPWKQDVVELDLARPMELREWLRGVEVLIHAAGVIHVRRTQEWYDVNHAGTVALARAAKKAGVRRFVFLSSIAAAGISKPGCPMRESDKARPLHHYGRSKWLAERDLWALHEPGVFDVVVLRPATFYGPPVPPRHVEMYKRILHGTLPLVGDGEFERCMIYIDNLVQAVLLAADRTQAGGNTYFIVDDEIYTTRMIFEAMADALGVTPRFVRLPAATGTIAYAADRMLSSVGIYVQPLHLLGESNWNQAASCEKAVRELGYAPRVRLREGMQRAVEWCARRGLLS